MKFPLGGIIDILIDSLIKYRQDYINTFFCQTNNPYDIKYQNKILNEALKTEFKIKYDNFYNNFNSNIIKPILDKKIKKYNKWKTEITRAKHNKIRKQKYREKYL